MKLLLSCTTLMCLGFTLRAQFHPPAGQPGTSAIHKDSSIISGWATSCMVQRGYQNVANVSSGYASAGTDTNGTGIPDGAGIVSLGDGGMAILQFASGLYDGPGYDFAVFENSFSDDFLELAFVEVSSDGINFYRFPATSYTQDTAQTASFGLTDATKINNLAGKYRALYGTPFDLAELSGTTGLDIAHVTHVRLIDVTGSIQPAYGSVDQYGNYINDPWPTEFASGGFDLDAVAAIHLNPLAVTENTAGLLHVGPNPARDVMRVYPIGNKTSHVHVFDMCGKKILALTDLHHAQIIDVSGWEKGMYVVHAQNETETQTLKLIIE